MGALFQDGLADGTVGRNITLTLTVQLGLAAVKFMTIQVTKLHL
jgi:hypothetical protein